MANLAGIERRAITKAFAKIHQDQRAHSPDNPNSFDDSPDLYGNVQLARSTKRFFDAPAQKNSDICFCELSAKK